MIPWLFQPSSPQSEPPWSPPDSRRSTLDLIETCILTLILCSWTAIHLDIPTQNRKRGWAADRLLCAIFAIFVPEYYLGIAFEELWESRLICLELKKLESASAEQGVSPPESPNDTVAFPDNPSHGNPETRYTNDQCHDLNTHRGFTFGGLWHIVCESWRDVFPHELKRGFYVEMGGFQLESDLGEGEDLPDGFEGRVTSRGAIELARVGLLPEVSWELVEDQSKSDTLAKVLVCLQACWMIIQCIARVARSIPLTLLEVHTVMSAVCASFMYFLWLCKPQDVMVATKVRVDDEKLKKLKDIVEANNSPSPLDDGGDVSRGFRLVDSNPCGLSLSSCRMPQSENRHRSQAAMILLVTTIYGGVHLTVWKGHFPSNLERILWIASATSVMVIPFLCLPAMFVLLGVGEGRNGLWNFEANMEFLLKLRDDLMHRKFGVWFVLYSLLYISFEIGVLFYVLARYYLFVESFASLRSLPLGSYTAIPWASLIPHF